MGIALPILLLLAGMILILGVLSILVIALVAKRNRCKSQPPPPSTPKTEGDDIDPWEEAGKRMKG